jgi:Phage tail assembly chaperone proteins, E, or 41 or 14
MNDIANPKRMREGFVDDKPSAGKPDPALERKLAAHPGPELENSPADDVNVAEQTWPIVVKLSWKSITNNKGETIDELSFREPRGGDINRYGNPVRMNSTGDWIIEERKMHYIMAALADILPPFLDALDPRDWNMCAYELMRFFLPTRRV